MKRIVRLTESDLARIVKRVIREQAESKPVIPKPGMRVVSSNVVSAFGGEPVTSWRVFDGFVVQKVEKAKCIDNAFLVTFKKGSNLHYLLFVLSDPLLLTDKNIYVHYDIYGDGVDYMEVPDWCNDVAVDRVGRGDFIN